MERDSLANTFFVAIATCLVCSFFVTAAAVGLKPLQDKNVALDKKKNILLAAGVSEEEVRKGDIDAIFKDKVETVVLDLATGETGEDVDERFMKFVEKEDFTDVAEAKEKYDAIAATDDEELSKKIDSDIAGLGRREQFTFIYLVKGDSGAVEKYVFPVRGKGLWSVLKGFVALESDLNTVSGLTYYEHGETPGLGGEVENPNWKAKWIGKKVFDDENNVKIRVVKGEATDEYTMDGLSGATITSRGVTNMLEYWFGEEGYKSYIEKQQAN